MATIHNIKQQKDNDQRTALLALAGKHDQHGQTACLTDDDLANLVDGQCTPAEQDIFLGHLARCSTCYRQWLELSEIVQSDRAANRLHAVYSLFKPRTLAWAGSVLAAAASVVLFLSITGENPPLQVAEPALQPQTELAGTIEPPAEQKTKTLQDRQPAAVPAPVTAATEGAGEAVRRKDSPARPGLENTAVQSRMAEGWQEASGGDAQVLYRHAAIHQWLQHVRQECLSAGEEGLSWHRLRLEGHALLGEEYGSSGMTVLSPVEAELIKTLLTLIAELEDSPGSRSKTCPEILATVKMMPDGS